MLARHAESLFWVGRYVERAGDAARMLDVTYHGLLESPPGEARRAWLDLLDVLQVRPFFQSRHDNVSAATVSEFLVLDERNPGSVLSVVSRARENVRSVRELVTTELWESVNTFWLELQGRDLQGDLQHQPYELYGVVRRRCQAIAGTAVETMPRDDGWLFLMLGWMLERAEMTCRLLRVRAVELAGVDQSTTYSEWRALLRSASAAEAYSKECSASMVSTDIIEFLLLNPIFPRSVLFALRSAERDLDRLGSSSRRDRASRLLGRLRADLEYRDVADLMAVPGALPAFLDELQDGVRGVAELVGVQFFRNFAELDLHALESAS